MRFSRLTIFLVLMGCSFLQGTAWAQPWQVSVTNVGRLDGRLERLVDVVQVTVNSTAATPVDANFLLEITGNNGLTFTNSSIFRDYEIPVNPGFQMFSIRNIQNFYAGVDFEDLLLANVSPQIIDYVTLQRRLPVGKYQICISVFDAQNPQILLGTSCLAISSAPKDPPVIMNPYEMNKLGVNVNFTDPPNLMVNWIHPGVFGEEYTLEVKKLSSLQQLGDFNQQNRPQIYFEALPDAIFPEQDIPGLSYVVTQDNNPFINEGDILAIRVTAQAPLGEYNNEGKSNIVIAIMDGRRLVGGKGKMDFIPLDPVFAKLVNLDGLLITDNQTSYTLNGFADVQFDFPGGNGPEVLRADVRNLDIQKGAPVVMGGEVIINPRNQNFLPQNLSHFVKITTVKYEFGEGFSAEGQIKTPDGNFVNANGAFQIYANGLHGEIEIESANPKGFSGFQTEDINLRLKRIAATYPQGRIMGTFDFSLFPGMEPVATEVDMESETFLLQINQPVYQYFSLVQGTAFGKILIKEVLGTVGGSWKTNVLTPNLSVPSEVLLQLANGTYCGISMVMDVNSTGVACRNFTRNCPFPQGFIDLGFLGLNFQEFEIEQLRLPKSGIDWDFRIRLSGRLYAPMNPQWELPEINGLVITPNGILFPAVSFDPSMLDLLPLVNIKGFDFKFKRFDVRNFTFPKFTWKGLDMGPWDLLFDTELRFPQQWEGPECLVGGYVNFTQGQVLLNAGGQYAVQANVDLNFNPECAWRMGQKFEAAVSRVAGQLLVVRTPTGFEPDAALLLNGRLVLGDGFECGPNPGPTAFSNLQWSYNAGLTGRIDNLQPTCNVKIGPFTGSIPTAALVFSKNNAGQQAKLESTAQLNLGGGRNANGQFILNLLNGDFEMVEFQLVGPFDLGIPETNPVVIFRLNGATLTQNGLVIDGRHAVVVGNDIIPATFDNLHFDWDQFRIKTGRVVLDRAFTFKAGIDPQTLALQLQATGLQDTVLQLDPGLMLQLAGTVVFDSTGLAVSGAAKAALNFGGYNLTGLTVVYTNDFAMGLSPLAVVSGAAFIYHNGQLIATITAQGFLPSPAFFANQLVPERIPLPSEEIAYLQIREQDEFLVDFIQEPNGNVLVRTKPNRPLMLVIPALQGNAAQPPQIPVVLQDLRINPATGAYLSGAVIATIPSGLWPGGAPPFPMTLKEISFTTRQTSAGSLSALFFKGDLNVLDAQPNASGEVVLGVQLDGRLTGAFRINQLNQLVPFDGGNGRVLVAVDSVVGNVSVPLSDPGSGQFVVQMHGALQVRGDGGQIALSTRTGLEYSEAGFRLMYIDLNGVLAGQALVMGDVEMALEGITALNLSYTPITGFDYSIAVDVALAMRMQGTDTLPRFPLRNIEIRKGGVVVIPAQNIHEGTVPGLQIPHIAFGGFRLKPLALRTQETTIYLNNFQISQVTALQPRVDFLLEFPGIPQMQNIVVGINDAGFVRGVFTGNIHPLDLSHDPILLPIGPDGLAFQLEYLLGELRALPNDLQDFAVNLRGRVRLPQFFEAENPFCDTTKVTLQLDRSGNMAGSINGFKPCGKLAFGPVRLGFGPSTLNIARISGQTTASLAGTAQAAIYRAQADSVRASGQLTIDLMTGDISNGQLTVVGPFDWQFPTPDSVMTFSIASATISSEGLAVSGGGSLRAGPANIPVNFNNVKFSLRDNRLKTGSIQINAPFALDVYLGGNDVFVVRDAQVPFQSGGNNGVRLTMPANLTLNSNGVVVNGNSQAEMYFAGNNFNNLKVAFVATNFAFQPKFKVATGRMDFILEAPNQQPQRVGYYDSTGFHVDQIPNFVPIPDTLGLPTKDIAYMVLRNTNGELLVNTQIVQGGVVLNTRPNQPLPVVMQAIKPNNGAAPTVNVQFQNLKINSSFQVIEGSITASLANPYVVPNFPIELRSISFERDATVGYRFGAAARLRLPADLNSMEVDIPSITFTPQGFECVTLNVGEFSNDFVANMQGQPLATKSFNNGELEVVLQGVSMQFCAQSGAAVQFSGQLSSNLFTPNNNTPPAKLHVVAGYQNNNWTAQVKTAHLQNQVVPFGFGEVRIDQVALNLTGNNVAIIIDGAVKVPELLGETSISFTGLRIATNGVSVGEVGANMLPQNLELFGKQDFLHVTALTVQYLNKHLFLTMDGRVNALERQFNFQGLKIGTNKTIALQSGNLNLLEPNQTHNILSDMLVLDTLMISVVNSNAQLTIGTRLQLPDPIESHQNRVSITVNKNGVVAAPVQLNVNPNVNVALGEFGNIRVTGVGVHIQNIFNPTPQTFKVYASAAVNMRAGNQGQASVLVGQPGSKESAGIVYGWGDSQPSFQNISVSGAYKFENDFFGFELHNQAPVVVAQGCNVQGFHVQVNVRAELKLNGFEGSLGFDGMCISKRGIEDLGTFGGADLSAMGMTITLGSFTYVNNPSGPITLVRSKSDDPSNPQIETVELNVEKLIQFGSSQVSMFGFSGGFDEILYYKDRNGGVYLNIDNVNMSLQAGLIEMNASMEYYKLAGDNFSIRIAGGIDIGGTGMAAVGYLRNNNRGFGFGIFVQVHATIPIIPGVVSMSSVGGGFFYKPEAGDFTAVFNAINWGTPLHPANNRPWEADNILFAGFLSAGVGLVGAEGNYAVEGRGLLMVTNSFLALEVRGTILKQDNKLTAGVYASYNWSENRLLAGGEIKFTYAPVIDGFGRLDFIAQPNYWKIQAHFELKVIGTFDVNSNILVYQDGFMVDLSVASGFNIWILEVRSSFELAVWWQRSTQNFGAYTQIYFKASIFAGIASVEGTLKGALIARGNDRLIYAGARVQATIFFIPKSASVWASIHNGKFSGGRGSNSEYDRLVAEARGQMEQMEAGIDAIANAPYTPIDLSIDNATMQNAGFKLTTLPRGEVQAQFQQFLTNERFNNNTPPQTFTDIRNLFHNSNRPEPFQFQISNLRNAFVSRKNVINTELAELNQRIEAITEASIVYESQAFELLEGIELMESPITIYRETNAAGIAIVDSFYVDSTRNVANLETLDYLTNLVGQLDRKYVQAIDSIQANIMRIDRAINDRIVASGVAFAITGMPLNIASGMSLTRLQQLYGNLNFNQPMFNLHNNIFGGSGFGGVGPVIGGGGNGLLGGVQGNFQNNGGTIINGGTFTTPTNNINPNINGNFQGGGGGVPMPNGMPNFMDERAYDAHWRGPSSSAVFASAPETNIGFPWQVQYERLSANDGAEILADFLFLAEGYYAAEVAYRWTYSNWALTQRNNLRNQIGFIAVNRAAENSLLDYVRFLKPTWDPNRSKNFIALMLDTGQLLTANQVNLVANKTANRAGYIAYLASGNRQDETTQRVIIYNEMQNRWNANGNGDARSAFYVEFVNKAQELWYLTTEMGLDSTRRFMAQQAVANVQLGQSNLSSAISQHANFSARINTLYQVKASMMTTLYGIYEIYEEFKSQNEVINATPVTLSRIVEAKQNLGIQLQAPRIGNVEVVQEKKPNQTLIGVHWNATHPSGVIAENSYAIAKRGMLFSAPSLSVGARMYATRAVYRESQNDTGPRNMSVRVRTRGPSGAAISTIANFTVQLEATPEVTGVQTVTVTKPATTPSTPQLRFPYYRRGVGAGTAGNSHWTKDKAAIVFRVSASDAVNDIARFEVKLGTTAGGNDIFDWKFIPGQRVNSLNLPDDSPPAADKVWKLANQNTVVSNQISGVLASAMGILGSNNGIQEITIRNLDLKEDFTYYLSVRAVNGMEAVSAVHQETLPVRFTDAAPGAPRLRNDSIGMPQNLAKGFQLWNTTITATPKQAARAIVTPSAPIVTVRWNTAQFTKGGLFRYEVVVSPSADPNVAFGELNRIMYTTGTSLSLEGKFQEFFGPRYAHVRAVGLNGLESDPLTYGPFLVNDPTPPRTPRIQATYKFGVPGFYLIQPAVDPETYRLSYFGNYPMPYRYSVHRNSGFSTSLNPPLLLGTYTADFTTNVWHALSVSDIAPINGSFDAQFVRIDVKDIPHATLVNIHTAATNYQGKESGLGRSGQLIIDKTPPPMPTLVANNNNGTISFTISNITDAESKIAKVEHRVVPSGIAMGATNYSFIVVNYATHLTSPSPVSGSTTLVAQMNYKLQVRITNGAGLQQTAEYIIPGNAIQANAGNISGGNFQIDPNINAFNPNLVNPPPPNGAGGVPGGFNPMFINP